jgi:cyanophycinase
VGTRRLYLLGGDIGLLDQAAADALAATGADPPTVAVLLIGGEGMGRHLPAYTDPWRRLGARPVVVAPGPDGRLDVAEAVARVGEAGALVLGGGDTERYQQLYAVGPLRGAIRERYAAGVPYLGLSAGATLAGRLGVRRPRPPQTSGVRLLPGLGLLPDALVAVHFDEGDGMRDLLDAMAQAGIGVGYGVGSGACLIFDDEQPRGVVGGPALRVSTDDRADGRPAVQAL